MRLTNHRIVLGITGSIAAYKGAELVRLLRGEGAEVEVVLTRGGAEFVTPLTLQALAGRPIHTHEHLDPGAEAAMGHIDLARWADLILVAPASANAIARLAAGLADDLLTTVCLASDAPLVLAPAMNRLMWDHAATRDNVERLRARGVTILGPGEGEQACGEFGPGRMLEPTALIDGVAGLRAPQVLAGRNVLLTAGPTREPIDPVRFLSNHSSGRMGHALAQAAAAAGARVTLVSGPVERPLPRGVERISVYTAEEMRGAVAARAGECDIFIAAAAVADYRPVECAPGKIKKDAARRVLELERTTDIVAEVAARPDRPFTIGFAAETGEVEENALAKLRGKGLDMVIANRVGVPGSGFDSEYNEVVALWPDGRRAIGRARKEAIARELIELIAERYHAQGAA